MEGETGTRGSVHPPKMVEADINAKPTHFPFSLPPLLFYSLPSTAFWLQTKCYRQGLATSWLTHLQLCVAGALRCLFQRALYSERSPSALRTTAPIAQTQQGRDFSVHTQEALVCREKDQSSRTTHLCQAAAMALQRLLAL